MRSFLKELRRRRVFRTAALYVVSAWLVMQAADVLFPGWGIPDRAINYLLIAAVLGFPIALVFGWMYDIGSDGIRRTKPIDAAVGAEVLKLRTGDYVILAAVTVVAVGIIYNTTIKVLDEPLEPESIVKVATKIENSIAVLPFASMSSDPDNEYFADGISDEILHRLGEFGDLHVIARTSSFAFKDSSFDVPRLTDLLRVHYLLQGSVRRDGNQLRILAQLVDENGEQVWSNSYDRELKGIFAIQSEIAESVATSIVPHLSGQRLSDSPRNIEAYQHYLVGREYVIKRVTNFDELAPVQLNRAIEIDPQFAEPYAELAVVLAIASSWHDDVQAELDRAQQAVDTALALKPDLARAHAAQGLVLMMGPPPTDYPRAEALLRKAIALDANVSGARNWLANILNEQGRYSEAFAVREEALEFDPLGPSNNANIARTYAEMGEFNRAEQRLLRMLELPQPSYVAHVTLMEIYNDTGRLVDANELAKWRVMQWVESSGSAWANWLFWNYAELGMWEAAEYWYDRNENESPEWVNLARRERTKLLVRQGRFAEAVKNLEFVIESAGGDLENLNYRVVSNYGAMQALIGNYSDAIETLEPVLDPAFDGAGGPDETQLWDGFHALTWAYVKTGAKDQARLILDAFDVRFSQAQAVGRLHLSSEVMMYARNTLLAGDEDLAIDRFRQAVDVGWRDYYLLLHDPRWDSVRGRPDFQELMATVKADMDVQRAQVEQIDAEKDFSAIVDQAIAARETAPRSVGN